MKNPTPRQIILLTSSVLALISLVLLIIVKTLWSVDLSLYLIVFLVLVNFISGYFVFSYYLEKFIYRKIKVIYKYIHDVKHPDYNKRIRLQDDVMQNVETEVKKWASSKKTEIAQLKKMEKYRREYLGNVSHELKTPIFNIQGYIESLIDGGRRDKKITKKFLTKALDNVNRLSLIVDDLEMISRSESGNLHLEFEVFNIKNLITEIMESLEMQTAEVGVRLAFKDPNQTPYKVYADRERIRQVLINLISNSIKYGKKGGETLLTCYDMEDNILVEVSDNGIGIETKHLPRLFERFYRIDKNRSRNKGGTGLGLAIVKHIIEAHKQTINVRSTIGVGATFGFTLKKEKETNSTSSVNLFF